MGGSTGEQRKGRSCQIAVKGGVRPGPPFPWGTRMLGEHLRCHGNRASSGRTQGRAQGPALAMGVCLSASWGCLPVLHLRLRGAPGDPRRGQEGLASPAEADGRVRPRCGTWKADKGGVALKRAEFTRPAATCRKSLLITGCVRNQHLQCAERKREREREAPDIHSPCVLSRHCLKKIKCNLFLSCCLKAPSPKKSFLQTLHKTFYFKESCPKRLEGDETEELVMKIGPQILNQGKV